MNKNKKLIPKRRFKEFENAEAWEQRKLGDLGSILTGSTPPINNVDYYSADGIPWITPTDISQNITFNSKKRLSLRGEKISQVVPKNTILVTCIASIGKNTMLGTVGSFNQQINSLIPNEDISYPYFLLTLSNLWSKQMKLSAASGTMQIVNKTEFSKIVSSIPGFKEQKKIGDFFECIDKQITLHQRKLDKVKALKKAYLSELFPAEGERKPKRRFPGFTDDWEQRKLGDVVNRVTRKNSNLESTLPLTISAIDGLVNQISYFNNQVASRDLSGYYLIKKGEFVYNKSYSQGFPFGAIKRLDKYKMGVLSTLYIVFSSNDKLVDSNYLASYYDTNNWHRQIYECAAEGARDHGLLNISTKDFFNTKLKMPSNIKEQEKIGIIFQLLDKQITLHQSKLDKLKNIKKAYLNEMFI